MCMAQHVFYNLVNPADVQKYTKPPDVPDSLWNQAQALNPDRSRSASKATTRC